MDHIFVYDRKTILLEYEHKLMQSSREKKNSGKTSLGGCIPDENVRVRKF